MLCRLDLVLVTPLSRHRIRVSPCLLRMPRHHMLINHLEVQSLSLLQSALARPRVAATALSKLPAATPPTAQAEGVSELLLEGPPSLLLLTAARLLARAELRMELLVCLRSRGPGPALVFAQQPSARSSAQTGGMSGASPWLTMLLFL